VLINVSLTDQERVLLFRERGLCLGGRGASCRGIFRSALNSRLRLAVGLIRLRVLCLLRQQGCRGRAHKDQGCQNGESLQLKRRQNSQTNGPPS
jgi:hypothetical protein